MRRPVPQDAATGGHDSFLDIVANIVGILIILVLVTGVRAKNFPLDLEPDMEAPDEAVQASLAALQKDQAVVRSLREDVLNTAEQIRTLQGETAFRARERDQLAVAVAAWEHKIESRRSQLDSESQADFDLARHLSEAKTELEQLRRQRAQAAAVKNETIVVESLPTPLSKTVDDREVHFQLRDGRVAFIPLQQLLDRFKADAQRRIYRLLELPEITDTVGPEGGFRLRYTLERRDVSPEMAMASGRGGQYVRLKRWTLIPISNDLGEPVQKALAEGSDFRRVIAGHRSGTTTITIWTYPDSFAEFRRLKKELYRMGFATAGRPLPHGAPIGGSPAGSKSAAE